MEEEGPFDAAIGFSQGSALLLSILMHHEITNALKTPPFKFVVLFSATISISPDQKFGQEYIEKYEKYYDYDRDMTKNSKESVLAPKSRLALKVPGQKSQLVAEYQDLIAQGIRAAVENGESEEEAISGIKDINSFPRIFHPFMCEERIRIPTVHISGKKDPYKLQAEMARRLCEKSVLRYIEHGGQHQVPRATKDVKKVVEAIEWAMHQATIVAFQY
ncbi:serine hydrolase FSH [Bisporella sp. PMI_857]|nr:serine hydrolase FSH [Bisporella sp. PMI_857]